MFMMFQSNFTQLIRDHRNWLLSF